MRQTLKKASIFLGIKEGLSEDRTSMLRLDPRGIICQSKNGGENFPGS